MGIRAVWAGLRGPHLGASLFLPSPQQRAQVSQQELRYLWVWVSLSATEAVQKVLLEHHPSWKYLQEVHTLLVNVQQGLRVSWAEVWEGSVCTCMHECVGVLTKGWHTWKGRACPEGCGRNGREEETASDHQWWGWARGLEMRLRPHSSLCLGRVRGPCDFISVPKKGDSFRGEG